MAKSIYESNAIDKAVYSVTAAAVIGLAVLTVYGIATDKFGDGVVPAVHYVATIETANGRIIRGDMESVSACVEFTRAIGDYVAAANCSRETR